MFDVSLYLESQGCLLIPLSYLFSCFLPSPPALSVLSFVQLMVHSLDFFLQKILTIFR